MNNKGFATIAASILISAIIYTITFYNSTHYQIEQIDGKPYRLDKHSGKMCSIDRNGFLVEMEEPPVERDLYSYEYDRLAGWAGQYTRSGTPYFGGGVYNGNDDVTVTAFVLELTYTNSEKRVSRKFKCKCKVDPLSADEFEVRTNNLGDGFEYSCWDIVGGVGYRK